MTMEARPLRRFEIYQALWKSFYSQEFYHDVAYQWRGYCLIYLFFLALMTSGVLCIQMQSKMNEAIPTEVMPLVRKMPELTVKGGVISTAVPGRQEILDARGKVAVIIDTSTAEFAPDPLENVTKISSSGVLFNYNHWPFGVKFDPKKDVTIDQKWLNESLDSARMTAALVVSPFILALIFIMYLLMALALSTIAANMKRRLNLELPYGALFRVTVVAMTPGLLLELISSALLVNGLLLHILLFTLMMMSVMLAVKAVNDPLEPEKEDIDDL